MDLRIEKTKNSIINAFIELRAQKSIEKITIKELCEKAKINKSTFYSHYMDIYDLTEQIETEVINSSVESLIHPGYIVNNPKEFTKDIFLSYTANQTLLKTLFSGNRSGNLIEKFEKCLKDLINQEIPDFKNDLKNNIILSYQIYGAYYAFLENEDTEIETTIGIISKVTEKIQKLYKEDIEEESP